MPRTRRVPSRKKRRSTRGQIGPLRQSKLDAEDIVQEVLLQAHRKRHQFSGTTEGELLAWLRSVLASRLAKLRRTV